MKKISKEGDEKLVFAFEESDKCLREKFYELVFTRQILARIIPRLNIQSKDLMEAFTEKFVTCEIQSEELWRQIRTKLELPDETFDVVYDITRDRFWAALYNSETNSFEAV